MIDFIREYQLDFMLVLAGAGAVLIILLLNTRFLAKSRKWILIFIQFIVMVLMLSERLTYLYSGDPSHKGYVIVRVSNFLVFFMTSAMVFACNLYLIDWLVHEGKLTEPPRRLKVTATLAAAGMLLAVIAAFTDLYYYFDSVNEYHRGQGFLIAYIIPVLCPVLMYTVVRQYKDRFSKLIYVSFVLFIYVPVLCGILQIFTFGISIANMAMAAVSISQYVLMYLDLNNTVERAHEIEIQSMQGEQNRMKRLFDQTATAFVSAVEKKDEFTKGNSKKVAEYAKKIASLADKDEDFCEEVYYSALLHDVGLIGIPDEVIKNEAYPENRDHDLMRQKPVIGEEILSSITEYPFLRYGAHFSHENYDGSGYPEGLKGNEIPEIARIITVADEYVSMTTKKRYRDELPGFVARETFVKGSGEKFDPVYADIMVKLIDSEQSENSSGDLPKIETEMSCGEYRDHISGGISVEPDIKKISFDCVFPTEGDSRFSAPSIILFDSYDGRAHNDYKSIEAYHYLEYGEIWFDQYSVSTAARNIEETGTDDTIDDDSPEGRAHYEIIAGRFEDHIKLEMRSKDYAKQVIVALTSRSKAAYIGLTGENCRLENIAVDTTNETVGSEDIPRIAMPLDYTDHLESDLKNVQIDRWRSASADGIEVTRRLKICFHTMSLPEAELVWHCPYIILYYSDDGKVWGPNYQEFQMIKLNGEDDGDKKVAHNRFIMKKTDAFPGWEKWKEKNKEGMECTVTIERKGGNIVTKTENLGIRIENTTTGIDDSFKVYVALSGDQVALTDIRLL